MRDMLRAEIANVRSKKTAPTALNSITGATRAWIGIYKLELDVYKAMNQKPEGLLALTAGSQKK